MPTVTFITPVWFLSSSPFRASKSLLAWMFLGGGVHSLRARRSWKQFSWVEPSFQLRLPPSTHIKLKMSPLPFFLIRSWMSPDQCREGGSSGYLWRCGLSFCTPIVSFDFEVRTVTIPLWLLDQENGQCAAMVKLQGTWNHSRIMTYATHWQLWHGLCSVTSDSYCLMSYSVLQQRCGRRNGPQLIGGDTEVRRS